MLKNQPILLVGFFFLVVQPQTLVALVSMLRMVIYPEYRMVV